jgi:hypothetical protein
MSKGTPLDACRAARLPAGGLTALAHLRAKGGVRVFDGEQTWIDWEGDRPDVIAAVLTVPDAELLEPRNGKWFIPGSQLPVFDVPPRGEAVPLDRAIMPAAFSPVEAGQRDLRPIALRLVRCETPRPTSAIRCPISALKVWVDTAPAAEIAALSGARCGNWAWIIGQALPTIADAERFWGEQVLFPLGWRAEPDWPEAALREAAAVGPNEILILTADGAEAISDDAFRPLTRAAIRRATA